MNHTLNYKKLNQLKEAITNSKTFNMDAIYHDCGTPSCVTGHLIAMNGIDKGEWDEKRFRLTSAIRKKHFRRLYASGVFYLAQEIGFDLKDAERVYEGNFIKKPIAKITKEETLRELNRLERKYRKREYKKMIKDIMAKPYQETPIDEPVKELV